MWAIEEAIHELERSSVVIHLFKKVLDEVRVVVELVRAYSLHIFLVVALLFEEDAAEILR